jgi:hypothetical protein
MLGKDKKNHGCMGLERDFRINGLYEPEKWLKKIRVLEYVKHHPGKRESI